MDKKPIEIIQIIDNPQPTWEEAIQVEEIDCLNKTGGEEEVYDAETVRSETSVQEIGGNLGHQPPEEVQMPTASIYIYIEKEEIELKSGEEVRKFLRDLESGELRLVESF
ncbi:10348_t:CDS:2 [Funneliformis geosporum]|nr:10348_t:CDS:2 [Funneliformis geosporum]